MLKDNMIKSLKILELWLLRLAVLASKSYNLPMGFQALVGFSFISQVLSGKMILKADIYSCYDSAHNNDQWSYKEIVRRLIRDNSSFLCRVFERGPSCIKNARSDMERAVFKEYFGGGEDEDADYTDLLAKYKNYFTDAWSTYCGNGDNTIYSMTRIEKDRGCKFRVLIQDCDDPSVLRRKHPKGAKSCPGWPNLRESMFGNSLCMSGNGACVNGYAPINSQRPKRDIYESNDQNNEGIFPTMWNITNMSSIDINNTITYGYNDENRHESQDFIHISPSEFAWWSIAMIVLGMMIVGVPMLLKHLITKYCCKNNAQCHDDNNGSTIERQSLNADSNNLIKEDRPPKSNFTWKDWFLWPFSSKTSEHHSV